MHPPEFEQLKREVACLAADRQHWAERFISEVEFARGLVRLHAKKAAGWNRLIDQAVKMTHDDLTAGKGDQFAQTIQQAEQILAPIGKFAKTYTVHCIGHAHIDMNWMWSWPETVAVTNDTFITVLKLMDEFPEFCLSQSQASVYAIARDYHPEIFEQIKKRVAEGRWEVTASHWVEGDKNLVSGEAIARHLLYTRRFMREHLGIGPQHVTIDWSPDTFGHAWTLPTLEVRGGVRHYYLCRGGRTPKPPVFWWRGPDGSRVLVNLETTWYLNQVGPHNAQALLAFCEKTGLRDWMNVYGVGDHGGGPTRRDILRAIDMHTWPIFPNFVFSTTKKYYAILEQHGDRWPTLDTELNYEFTGCYTSQAAIKQANRGAESRLVETEALAAVAHRILGRPYPGEKFRRAWIDALFSHFHDILPGSGVRATRHYNQGKYQEILATSSLITTNALRALAEKVDTTYIGKFKFPTPPAERESIALGAGVGRGAGEGNISSAGHIVDGPRGFVFFNPTAWPRNEVVTVTVWDADTGAGSDDLHAKTFVVRTPAGKVLPAQKVAAGEYWGHKFTELAFPVTVGPLAYTSRVVEEGQPENVCYNALGAPTTIKTQDASGSVVCDDRLDWEKVTVHTFAMENEFLAVDFDRVTGGITRLVDKVTGKNLADPKSPLGVLEYRLEQPGAMSSWVIHPPQRIDSLELVSFEKDLRGPHVATVIAKAKIKGSDSTATITYALKAGQPWLEVSIAVFWVERGGPTVGTPTLRMRFPLALTEARARYEIPFGSISRDLTDGQEVPALRWADVTGKILRSAATAGLALLNDCKHGHALEGSTLSLTLIRSSYEPDPLPEVGEHTMRLALVPHGKVLSAAQLTRLGAAFNHPLAIASTGIHEGNLPSEISTLVSCTADNVVIAGIKKAEDEEALIVRLQETLGRSTAVKVNLDVLLGTAQSALEVDFLERPAEKSSAGVVKNGFTVKVPAHGVTSVRVEFAK